MHRLKGIAMIVFGSVLWGATGPMMEWVLRNAPISVSTLIAFRLTLAGGLILLFLKIQKVQLSLPWRQKIWARKLIIFGMFGMLGAQYAFVQAINTSDAVIATLFQFLAPIYIIAVVSWGQRRWPPIIQVAGILVTLGGLFLLLTNGSLAHFSLSMEAVYWGIAVGLTFAFYTLYPVRLLSEWGVLVPVGWAMVIGGVAMFLLRPWPIIKQIPLFADWKMTAILLLVVVMGTFAFILFLGSMKYITPIETSILTSVEPLTAIAISAIWFQQILGKWQVIGTVIMLAGIIWLSLAGNRARRKS